MVMTQNDDKLLQFEPEYELTQNVDTDYLFALAQKGDADAMLKIANLYLAGARNNDDYKKAFSWAVKAKNNGSVEADFLLGEMYQYGVGCNKDIYLAMKSYRTILRDHSLTEKLGHSTISAIYENYAKILLQKPDLKNLYRAKSFYKRALQYGSLEAKEKIGEIELLLKEESRDFIFKVLFAVSGIIVSFFAVRFIVNKCSEPATHFIDSVFHKALTVQDADADYANEIMEHNDTVFLEDDTAELENYHFISYEEIETNGYLQCNVLDATATSEQIADVGAQYGVKNVIDGKLYTNWQEAENDAGIGQKLSFFFEDEEQIKAIGIYLGNGRSEKAYKENNRPAMLTFSAGTQDVACSFEDTKEMKYIELEMPLTGKCITMTIDSVYQGKSQENKTSITEIIFYH